MSAAGVCMHVDTTGYVSSYVGVFLLRWYVYIAISVFYYTV